MKTNFIDFWTSLFVEPKAFFSKYLADTEEQPPYFVLAIILFGIGAGINRLDKQLTKYDLNGRLDDIDFLNNWIGYWLIAVIGGIIGGILLYLIGGWFFNVRLKWSKGTGDIDKSRYIYLYSGVVSSAVVILLTLVSTLISSKPCDSESAFNLWDLTSLALLIFFAYYSVYVSYSGVRAITDADKMQSKIWFLILPIILYTLVYFALFASIVNSVF